MANENNSRETITELKRVGVNVGFDVAAEKQAKKIREQEAEKERRRQEAERKRKQREVKSAQRKKDVKEAFERVTNIPVKIKGKISEAINDNAHVELMSEGIRDEKFYNEQISCLDEAMAILKQLEATGETYGESKVGDISVVVSLDDEKKPVFFVEYPIKNSESSYTTKRSVLYTYDSKGNVTQNDMESETYYKEKRNGNGGEFKHIGVAYVNVLSGNSFVSKKILEANDGAWTPKGRVFYFGDHAREKEIVGDVDYIVPDELADIIEQVLKAKQAHLQKQNQNSENEEKGMQ